MGFSYRLGSKRAILAANVSRFAGACAYQINPRFLKPRFPIRPLWIAKEVHGYSFPNDQADRDLSENATATIAHLASRLALLFVLAEYSLRRPLP